MKVKKVFVTSFVFFILILTVFLSACSFHFVQQTGPLTETVVAGQGKEKIVLVDISGVITAKKRTGPSLLPEKPNMISCVREELSKAFTDKRVRGLILRINSPGGTVTSSDIIYREIKKFKEAKKVPVVACMMDMAASGGYYVALAADAIVAHPTTITGGIGVVAFKFNAEGLFEKVGIKDDSVQSGDKKDLLSPFRPNSEDERKILQTIVDELHERFISIVAENRAGLTRDEIISLADGRVYTTGQALSLKLIDKVGYLDDAIALLKKKANITEAKTVVYHRPFSYRNNIYSGPFNPEINTINLINIDMGSIKEIMGLQLLYLWMP
ncbi:MAG: signal peptide peptidase SppA [Thermodesulfobacteriota bacterium]|nr:signal peptide peptidase SppA [Thermodesulfobacteriota bacterium]